jgi:hypothetical protein
MEVDERLSRRQTRRFRSLPPGLLQYGDAASRSCPMRLKLSTKSADRLAKLL